MKLHLGCGDKYWPGWVNVDIDGGDIQSDITDLPFDDESVDEIQGIHIFEHLHRLDAPKALQEWHRVLKKDGKLVLELPCLDKVTKMIIEGEKNLRLTLMALYGDPRYGNEYMLHRWGWSKEEITKELQDNQFSPKVKEPFFHIKKRDMRVEARRI